MFDVIVWLLQIPLNLFLKYWTFSKIKQFYDAMRKILLSEFSRRIRDI